MANENTELQAFLQKNSPTMTKEAMEGAIREIEDSFIKAATGAGSAVTAAELVKLAEEHPDQWHNLVNNYVSECLVAAEQEKQAAAVREQEALQKQAQSAEAIALGQLMAHAMVDELTKIGEEMYAAKKADDEKDEKGEKEDKDKKDGNPFAKKDDDKKDDKKDDDKKDGGDLPPALAQAMKSEEKEGAAKPAPLPLEVVELRSAIRTKVAHQVPITPQEDRILGLCKLAESGYNVDWSGVK
jgi:hypothetical protein